MSGPSSADGGATVNAGFDCSFVIFQGIQTSIAKNPIFCDFFQGRGLSGPTVTPLDPPMFNRLRLKHSCMAHQDTVGYLVEVKLGHVQKQ